MRKSLFLLVFPLLIVIYIALKHPFYFLLYPYSAVNPYIYYRYSPGFWAVDFAFWVFSPLMHFKFRKTGEDRLLALLYTFCLDASSVGIFLIFFCLVYGISIFASEYYTYAFIFMFLFIVPISHLRIKKKHGSSPSCFPCRWINMETSYPGEHRIFYFIKRGDRYGDDRLLFLLECQTCRCDTKRRCYKMNKKITAVLRAHLMFLSIFGMISPILAASLSNPSLSISNTAYLNSCVS